jgi:phage replication O-like protein O
MKNPWRQYSKLNPQREDGNRQIENGVFQALMRADLSGSEFRIVMAIIDKTWGFGKESDVISVSQIMQLTEIPERTVRLSLKSLKDRRVLVFAPSNTRVQQGSPINEILFNKHHDTWKSEGCKKLHGCKKLSEKGAKNCISGVQKIAPTKETITKETITKEKKNIRARFEIFWNLYPKKKSKGQAETAFSKINPDEQLLATMIARIEQAKTSEDWIEQRGKYIPHPATWLNAKGWEDEETETNPLSGKVSGTTLKNMAVLDAWRPPQ